MLHMIKSVKVKSNIEHLKSKKKKKFFEYRTIENF